MDDHRRTLVGVALVVGLVMLVILIVGSVISRKKIVSPVPDEAAVRIIFLSPTSPPSGQAPMTPTVTPTP